MTTTTDRQRSANNFATRLIRDVCKIGGDTAIIDDARVYLAANGVIEAVRRHDDATLFDWLMTVFSYQGISDTIAYNYMERHGRISADSISSGLKRTGLCPKLTSYWQFEDCGYRKSVQTCTMPASFGQCPLPRHKLRNGRLNQSAYSLLFFMRDVARGDLVTWIDQTLANADTCKGHDRGSRMATAVVEPLTYIYGVSDKVLSLSLAMLLLAGDPDRERWQTAGAAMIAIDTLVHNWFHRTGILRRLGASHPYGVRCYGDDGCADIIRRASGRIDATAFNPDFPRRFPRLVQHAIWRFCSQNGLDECNGNQIDDLRRCDRKACGLFERCGRVILRKPAQTP